MFLLLFSQIMYFNFTKLNSMAFVDLQFIKSASSYMQNLMLLLINSCLTDVFLKLLKCNLFNSVQKYIILKIILKLSNLLTGSNQLFKS